MISQFEKTNPIQTQFLQRPKMNERLLATSDYENKTAFRLEQNKPKQSQGIKRVRSIFRRFILAFLTQAPHINITNPIVDPETRTSPKMNKKNLKNQVSVLTIDIGIFSSFLFAAGM